MADYLLGIDIGTQGSKGVLCDIQGQVIAYAYREHGYLTPHPGWFEQDARSTWWGDFVFLTTEILIQSGIRPSQIGGIGVSSFVPSLLPIDAQGNPLRPAIIYTDRRSSEELEEIKKCLEEGGISPEDHGPYWLASPIPQLMWVKKNEPQTYKKIAHILQGYSYIAYRLTGITAVDHAMKRSYAPLYDSQIDGWSKERASLLGIDPKILPEKIGWATEILGAINGPAVEETGLAKGTPMILGTGDAFSEMVGAGLVVPGAAALMYGSFAPLMIIYDHPISAWEGYHCLPGLYFGGVGVTTGAALTRWFRDQFGQIELSMEKLIGENSYQLLDRQAARVSPGCDGLIAIPDFSGERGGIHPNLSRGALLGLTTAHTRAHIYRALLESTGYELRYQLENEKIALTHITAVGGGVRSNIWTQIVSDILNIYQETLDIPYGAPFGDAYLAGMGVGIFPDTHMLQEKWIRRIARTIRPDISMQRIYQENYEIYCAARQRIY
jgi:xylulokinase